MLCGSENLKIVSGNLINLWNFIEIFNFLASHMTFEITNDYHKINCINLFIHCGLQSDKLNVLLELTHQILRAEFFDALRTKEQQGYVVDCILRRSHGNHGIKFIVESLKKPEYIEGRIKRFLMTMRVRKISISSKFLIIFV